MDWSGFCAGIARFGPAIFFTFVAAFYTARILWLGRRQGASPVAYGVPGTLPRRIYTTFRIFRLLIWIMSVGRAIWPPFGLLALPLPMDHPGADDRRQSADGGCVRARSLAQSEHGRPLAIGSP